MKLLGIDLDNQSEKADLFFRKVSLILDTEVVEVNNTPRLVAATGHPFNKFSHAAFSVEKFIYSNDNSYWSANKPYWNVLYVWGDYCPDNIKNLKPLDSVFDRDLLIFSTDQIGHYGPSWVYGNITAVLKWSSSLFKLDANKIGPREIVDSDLGSAIWFAKRIGLNVKVIKR